MLYLYIPMAYKPLTEEDRQALLAELDGHQAGTRNRGRWLDERGHECDADDEGAAWYEYNDEENANWLSTLDSMMQRMRVILTQEKVEEPKPPQDPNVPL